ncbi:hypothetical protein EDD37DRAFT_622903 [Exophiala viscosa]|uniref:Pal1 cell morphology protein n=1 Tax=Exophiala viscosa TaxID=2486360 RepID=A0AAN6E7K0_9EURO|nr:hypothetical protein EDD36DRAFT_33374 [Exophiala viscosa]KAI1627633.1 hypothetical protein EDD37DRAFT_622903 [Exophiala viscosa]
MESADDKKWATQYLLDPLNAPDPSQEDGPGNSFRGGASTTPVKSPQPERSSPGRRLSKHNPNNPYRKGSFSTVNTNEINRSASLHTKSNSNSGAYPSPPPSGNSPNGRFPSPQQSPRSPSHRQEAFGGQQTGRRRASSLTERYPGDKSHRPLDQLAKEKYIADRARHATRKHHIQPDTIDNLDRSGGTSWHHGGPYDATLFARNNSTNSPLAAVADSNLEALKATPKERIVDSVRGHRPLDGVALYAPGNSDRMGNVYNYEEGENMMTEGRPEGGAYKRWPGIQYLPEDIKGKGEPSYSIEKALKEHHIGEESKAEGDEGIELQSRHRSSSGAVPPSSWNDGEGQTVGRSGSLRRLSGGLKRRFGSVSKRKSSGQGEF